jgi:hypothetical protein
MWKTTEPGVSSGQTAEGIVADEGNIWAVAFNFVFGLAFLLIAIGVARYYSRKSDRNAETLTTFHNLQGQAHEGVEIVKDETRGGLKGVLVSIKGWMGMKFNVRANLTDGNRKDPAGLRAISASRRRLGRSSR